MRDELQAALGDRYALERELGGGGMSRVFLATETALGRAVVIKVIPPEFREGISAERFAREVKLAARLQQANIVPLLAAGEANGAPYYTMPFVSGESLRARLARGDRVSITEAINILRDVVRALAYAHGEGVVHRDIKPENILISGAAAVVTDFGIAKALADSRSADSNVSGTITQIGSAIGTAAYMAPEQAAGDPAIDQRADLYAWGLVAWELIAGKHPFAEHTTVHALIAAQLRDTPQPLGDVQANVPPRLSVLVARCLSKDPSARPESAADLLQELDHVTDPGSAAQTSASHSTKSRWYGVVAATLVLVAIVSWMSRRSTSAPNAENEKSLAVLPFVSVGNDTANTYFAEGMADELTTSLARIAGLRVAATSSAFTYRDKNADARDVGKALNVHTVLEGRVRRAGTRIRLSVQLTNTANGAVLWSNSYEREMQDVFAVQDELSSDIVGALRITFADRSPDVATLTAATSAGTGVRAAEHGGTRDTAAYDLYLRGLHFLQLRGDGVSRSIPYFRKAVGLDPGFARAWAQLGTAYALLPLFSVVAADSVIREAHTATTNALRLDPLSAEAHAAAGASHHGANEWADAEREFRRAIALDSQYVFAHRAFMGTLAVLGRRDEAVREARLAAALDPLTSMTHAVESLILLNADLRSDALAAARRAVELDSLNMSSRASLALAEYFSGRIDAARALAKGARILPQSTNWIGFVRAATGTRADALQFIQEMEKPDNRTLFKNTAIAWTWLGAGDTTRALDALQRAARAREPIAWVGPFGHPVYNSVRSSARFAEVIRAFGVDPSPFVVSKP